MQSLNWCLDNDYQFAHPYTNLIGVHNTMLYLLFEGML